MTVDTPAIMRRDGYNVSLTVTSDTSAQFNQIRELWAKTDYGTAVHPVPGERPYGEDMTTEQRNTQYVDFTSGTTGKPQDGWYLLRPSHRFYEDESPEGHSYYAVVNLFFLGTDQYYQQGYVVGDMLDAEDDAALNEWGI